MAINSRLHAREVNRQAHSPVEVLSLPVELSPIGMVIERSRCILDLLDDWDDEGAPAISRATWDRAIVWLSDNALDLWTDRRIVVDTPIISAGPDGSVDVHWKDDRRQLLVNIPADAIQPMEFFGDDRGHTVVKGVLDESVSDLWLFDWLMKAPMIHAVVLSHRMTMPSSLYIVGDIRADVRFDVVHTPVQRTVDDPVGNRAHADVRANRDVTKTEFRARLSDLWTMTIPLDDSA